MSHDVHQVRAFEHPGEGRKRAKMNPKGRQVDPTASHEIELLLGDRPRRRDLLIEHLHLIQDTYKQISAAHLAALADEMKLSFAEVFETATFYAHFDVVKEGEANIPPLTIRVCWAVQAVIGGLALVGLIALARHGRAADALWLAVPLVYISAVHFPLLTEARQSLPAQPVVLLLATIGVRQLTGHLFPVEA